MKKFPKNPGLTPNGEVKTAQETKSELQIECKSPHKHIRKSSNVFGAPPVIAWSPGPRLLCASPWKKGAVLGRNHILKMRGFTIDTQRRQQEHGTSFRTSLAARISTGCSPRGFESKGRETLFPDEGWQKGAKPGLAGRARTNQDKGQSRTDKANAKSAEKASERQTKKAQRQHWRVLGEPRARRKCW